MRYGSKHPFIIVMFQHSTCCCPNETTNAHEIRLCLTLLVNATNSLICLIKHKHAQQFDIHRLITVILCSQSQTQQIILTFKLS